MKINELFKLLNLERYPLHERRLTEESISLWLEKQTKETEDMVIHRLEADKLPRETEDAIRVNLRAIAEEINKELSPGYYLHKRYFPGRVEETKTDPALALFMKKAKIDKNQFAWDRGYGTAAIKEDKTKVDKRLFHFKETSKQRPRLDEKTWWQHARNIFVDRNSKKVLASKCARLPVNSIVREDSLTGLDKRGWQIFYVDRDRTKLDRWLKEEVEQAVDFLLAKEIDGKWSVFETQDGETIYFVQQSEDGKIRVEDEAGKESMFETFDQFVIWLKSQELGLVGVIYDEDREGM